MAGLGQFQPLQLQMMAIQRPVKLLAQGRSEAFMIKGRLRGVRLGIDEDILGSLLSAKPDVAAVPEPVPAGKPVRNGAAVEHMPLPFGAQQSRGAIILFAGYHVTHIGIPPDHSMYAPSS